MAGEIADPIKELAKSLIIDTIKEWYSYIKSYNDNMKDLRDEYNNLVSLNNTFSNMVEQRKQQNLHKSTSVTDGWLAKVHNLVEKDENLTHLIDEKTRKGKDQCCFGRVNCNLYRRYEMSKIAQIKVNEIRKVIEGKPDESMITEPRTDLIPTPNEFMLALSSRVKLMDKILQKLRDDHVNVVGIFGMGAVGKTTLAKEIANKGAKDMFEKIVMVEISESPNVERIQDQIAEQLKVKLDGSHSTGKKAELLYNTLRGSRKVLVILDNVWKNLDLREVGIPRPSDENTQQNCCKLLVTSRMKDVCEVVGASSRDDILEVLPLNDNEARLLFRARVGDKANDDSSLKEKEEAEKKMLKKCGGLPLSIVALADVLKNQELSTWEHFAAELEKSVSISQAKISGVHRQTYSILETSYKLMESEDKRSFFLLACLFPLGASIPVEQMMRYGIGLGLFQQVDNLIEAMDLANTWVDELISSALLLEDGKGFAKVHDVVRASTISLAEKGGNMVMVEAFPRWLFSETCQKYYAISLMSGADHSRLDGLNSDKLQILILDSSQPRDRFSDGFFQGITNLKVLVLKGMEFTPGLPNSIRKLKRSLRTLLLEECWLGNITVIGELTNLVVLSLRSSIVEEIPEAIGSLCSLRLLDLSDCRTGKGGIAANVLSKLSLLEGLHAFNFIGSPWRFNNNDGSVKVEYSYYARFAELNYLSFLKLLVFRVEFNDWAIDDDQLQFLNNLDHFFIYFGFAGFPWAELQRRGYSRVLKFHFDDSWSSIVKYNGVRVLLEKTQFLWVDSMRELQHINDDIQQQEEDETKMQLSINPFPHLIDLFVLSCPKMQSLSSTPFKAPNLTELYVGSCDNMKYIFVELDADHQLNNAQGDPHTTVTFPRLQRMNLQSLPKLESVTGLIKRGSATTNDDQQPGHHILFKNHKTIFPSLEHLILRWCDKIVQLWEVNCKEMSYYSSFNNLQYLTITGCRKLETLGSLSIATALVQLQKLVIRLCPLLREVISSEEEEEIEAPTFGDKILPSLQSVELYKCPELKVFISGGKLNDKFLKLLSFHQLNIARCPKMVSFSFGPSFKTPKLNKVILDSSEFSKDEIKDDINSFLQSHNKPKPK